MRPSASSSALVSSHSSAKSPKPRQSALFKKNQNSSTSHQRQGTKFNPIETPLDSDRVATNGANSFYQTKFEPAMAYGDATCKTENLYQDLKNSIVSGQDSRIISNRE
jgi:hypothetical protein